MSMCRIFNCVVGRGCLLWTVPSLGKPLVSRFPASFCSSKAKFAFYSRCFLTSYFCIPVPYNEKDLFFWVLVLKGLVGLPRTDQLQLLQHYWLGHRLGLLNCLPWKQTEFILSFFETASKYCISDSFADYMGRTSLEELILKLKLQSFGQLIWRTDPLGKTLMLRMIKSRRRRARQRMRLSHGTTDSMDMSFSKLWESVMDREAWSAAVHVVTE